MAATPVVSALIITVFLAWWSLGSVGGCGGGGNEPVSDGGVDADQDADEMGADGDRDADRDDDGDDDGDEGDPWPLVDREGWVRLPPTTFMMGSTETEAGRSSNESLHQVTLTGELQVMASEVTRAQFREVMGFDPSTSSEDCPECPVENVTWEDAAGYCNALSHREGLPACYSECSCGLDERWSTPYECPGYRLPTEAEWEMAARAGLSEPSYGPLDEIAWYEANSEGRTHRVGALAANPWGLNDVLGNVAEWCHDQYQSDLGSESVSDPVGEGPTSDRVIRGGAFDQGPDCLRFAWRRAALPARAEPDVGFRVVRSRPVQ